ncbi:MAG: hypothetical protein QNJ98_16655 [Planctomycetota bacterium]|nr:hypothetical protein [Planctomycetota bacterium]
MTRLRRRLLCCTCLALALSAVPAGNALVQAKETGPARPTHVVLVVLGGGVRARDMLDAKKMPKLAAMAEAGRVIDEIRAEAANGYEGVARLLTGAAAPVAGPETHPDRPTLMEYVRVGRNLPAEKVWYVSFEGEDQLRLAYSTHPAFGAGVGPAVATGMGAFGEPLKSFLDRLGRPDPQPKEAWTLLRGLRARSRGAVSSYLPEAGVPAGLPRSERMERALLEEINRRSLLVRGPAPRDERAWRAAKTVLQVHRPILTVIRLGEAEQAQKSEAQYERVLWANDAGLGRLRGWIAADRELKDRTLVVVVSELGRDATPNERGGLDQADDSEDHRELALVAFGPGFKAKKGRVKRTRRIEDVCATLGILLGVPTPHAEGEAWTPYLREAD